MTDATVYATHSCTFTNSERVNPDSQSKHPNALCFKRI